MEDNTNPEAVSLENVQLPEKNPEENNSKSSENVHPTESVNLKTDDGAQKSEESPDFKDEYGEVYEFKQSHTSINAVPEKVFEMINLRILDLSHNSIMFITSDLKKLTFLQNLDLSYNNLTSLPYSFIESPWLKRLNLSNNQFNHVPPALYNSVPCLRILDISFNFIESFSRPPLCANYLEVLTLNSNKLTRIPRWIFDLKSLKVIDLNNNSLKNIPSNFLHEKVVVHLSRSIKILNLQNCCITNDRLNFVSSIMDLEILILSNTFEVNENYKNTLQVLNPNVIGRARNLKYLLASNVDLFFLHHNFDCLKNIQYLDLSHNALIWLPDSFCNLITLTECKLNSNSISFLPAEFGKLANLKKFFLSDNNLVELPQSFTSLNLEICDLYNNQLEKIDTKIMKLKSLKGIDLENNCLDFNILCGEENLGELYETYCSLKERYRKDKDLKRVDIQNLTKETKSERRITNSRDIPDFIANYCTSQVYSLKSETLLTNWEDYRRYSKVHNYDPEYQHMYEMYRSD